MKIKGLTLKRSLTTDLFATTLEESAAKIARVIISELAAETFHARILFERDGRAMEIDARPSDALALAVRIAGVRIFASIAVLDQAALGADGGLGDEGEEGSTLESIGEGIVDPRLDVFRDFVNSLEAGPASEGRGSPGWPRSRRPRRPPPPPPTGSPPPPSGAAAAGPLPLARPPEAPAAPGARLRVP